MSTEVLAKRYIVRLGNHLPVSKAHLLAACADLSPAAVRNITAPGGLGGAAFFYELQRAKGERWMTVANVRQLFVDADLMGDWDTVVGAGLSSPPPPTAAPPVGGAAVAPAPIKILLLVAAPAARAASTGNPGQTLETFRRGAAAAALAALKSRKLETAFDPDSMFVSELWVTAETIGDMLREHQPTIVQFLSHGGPGDGGGEDKLFFPTANGGHTPLSGRFIKKTIQYYSPGTRGVVLSACYSDGVATAMLADVAGAAATAAIDWVVVSIGEIQPKVAQAFAGRFYSELAQRQSLDDAFRAGKMHAEIAGDEEQAELLQLRKAALPPPLTTSIFDHIAAVAAANEDVAATEALRIFVRDARDKCAQCGGKSCTATPLHQAVMLTKTPNAEGLLPLAAAVSAGSLAAVDVLLKVNGDALLAFSDTSPPPMHLAVLIGHEPILKRFGTSPHFTKAWREVRVPFGPPETVAAVATTTVATAAGAATATAVATVKTDFTAEDLASEYLPGPLFFALMQKVPPTLASPSAIINVPAIWRRRLGPIPHPTGDCPAPKPLPAVPSVRQRRILVMDGGGSRGVVMVRMLKVLLGDTPPHEVFDMICGTSTGGILALALGVRKMTLDDCEGMYLNFARAVFPYDNKPARVMQRFVRGGYSTQRLVDIFQGDYAFGTRWITENADASPHVFAVAATGGEWGYTPALFCNYGIRDSTSDLRHYARVNTCTLVEACRATSAAPTYFAPFELHGQTYYDGGLVANNPVSIAIDEARQLWGPDSIGCVVSLGTGESVAEISGTLAGMPGPAVLFNAVASASEHNRGTFEARHRLYPRDDLLYRLDPNRNDDRFPAGQPLDVGNLEVLLRMSNAGATHAHRHKDRVTAALAATRLPGPPPAAPAALLGH